jgi:hypothetical protein
VRGRECGAGRQSKREQLVRAEGLEPSRALRPNGFSYHPRLSPPPSCLHVKQAWRLWSGLSLHRSPLAVGAARLVSTPSRSKTCFAKHASLRAWLGIAISQVSPTLSSSASPVSRRALNFRLSPMRLPIPPRPRGFLHDKATRGRVPRAAANATIGNDFTPEEASHARLTGEHPIWMASFGTTRARNPHFVPANSGRANKGADAQGSFPAKVLNDGRRCGAFAISEEPFEPINQLFFAYFSQYASHNMAILVDESRGWHGVAQAEPV